MKNSPLWTRVVSPVVLFSFLITGTWCSTTANTKITSLEPVAPEIPRSKTVRAPVRIVLRGFKDLTARRNFDIIPDDDYGDRAIRVGDPHEVQKLEGEQTGEEVNPEEQDETAESEKPEKPESDEKKKSEGEKSENIYGPDHIDSGAVAREVTETALFKSNRFEIVPDYILNSKLKEYEQKQPGDPTNLLSAARDLNVRYIALGDLTNFEIKEQKSYWKVPLWVILLVAAFALNDRVAKELALEASIRICLYAPGIGVGWDKVEMNVDLGMDMRLMDTHTGSVVFTSSKNFTRLETVRNLDLLVWKENTRVKITRFNAGRQIRFVSHALVLDLLNWMGDAPVTPVEEKEPVKEPEKEPAKPLTPETPVVTP